MNAIELRNIDFSYNGDPVLSDVSVLIEKGEYAGVIGPNGGGKTTMIKIMLGLIRPDKGTVRLFDKDISEFNDWSKIGYLSQRAAHFDIRFPITVKEVVSQGRIAKAGLFKRFTETDKQAIRKAIEISGVGNLEDKLVAELSGGERQRAFIARALASEPEILILDEPAAGVDVGSQSRFYQFLKDLNDKHGMTIVFVTHDVDIIAHEATNLICVNNIIVSCGNSDQVLKDKRKVLEALYGKNVHFMFDTD